MAVEANLEARQVLDNSFSSAEFVDFVDSVTEDLVKAWGCKYSRVGLVLISGRPLAKGFLVLMQGVWDRSGTLDRAFIMRSHASEDRLKLNSRGPLPVFTLVESVSSMSNEDLSCMSRSTGMLPYKVDASGLTPCRRARLFWFDWPVRGNDSVQIFKPSTTASDDYGRIDILLDCAPEPYLSLGWSLAGGADHKLPTVSTSQPKAQPGFQPAGISS